MKKKSIKARSSPPTRRPKGSAASYERCAFGQCQTDAHNDVLGVWTSQGWAPVCPRCQRIAKSITKTVLVEYEEGRGSRRGGGDNDMVKVGGVLRQRRQPKKVKVKVKVSG